MKSEEKTERKRQAEALSIEQEQTAIDAVNGKYVVKLFSDIASGKYGVFNMYEKIANYANTYQLTIVNIAKPEDGFISEGVTVIFQKENKS